MRKAKLLTALAVSALMLSNLCACGNTGSSDKGKEETIFTTAAAPERKKPSAEFTKLDDYQNWVKEEGYPKNILVAEGFEDGHTDADIFGIPQESFNAYIKDYNDKLAEAVKASSILKETAYKYTTVPLIAGKVTFNEDGLHYSDASLEKLLDHIAAGK